MTWYTTWPLNGRPQYAEHRTEAKAEAHAKQLVDSGKARVATFFEMTTEETA